MSHPHPGQLTILQSMALQGHCTYLEGLVTQQDGIVSLLERRIAMLEQTLQQERADLRSRLETNMDQIPDSGAAGDVLVSHPLSQLSTPSKLSGNVKFSHFHCEAMKRDSMLT